MKRKLTLIALAICLAAVAVTGASIAFFSDSTKTTNVFTMGNVDIELTETDWVQPTVVVPGTTYKKNPTVNNIGSNSAWVRINVTLSDAAAFTAAAQAHNIKELDEIFTGHDETKWSLAGVSKDTTADTITYSYYFKTVLAPSASTGALFESVKIPESFTKSDMTGLQGDFQIDITADAIQAQGFETPALAFATFDAQA